MILHVGPLADDPLDAAAQFHAEILPQARALLRQDDDLTLIFAPGGHEHQGWRLAVVQALARDHAPRRVNAVAGASEQAVAAAADWLTLAQGITGQYLRLDGQGAGSVL